MQKHGGRGFSSPRKGTEVSLKVSQLNGPKPSTSLRYPCFALRPPGRELSGMAALSGRISDNMSVTKDPGLALFAPQSHPSRVGV